MKKDIFIITLDPYVKGGVLAMMEFIYNNFEKHGFNPVLVYNIVPSLRKPNNNIYDITFTKLLKISQENIFQEKVFEMIGFGIRRILPEFEFLNYILNLKYWKEILDKSTLFFSVGGNNLCALPLVLLNKKFSIWVASPLLEDRIDRIKKEPFLRKIRDLFSLPILLFFEKLIFKKAKKILALSEYTKRAIIKKYKISESKIEVAPYPVDLETFKPIDFYLRKNDYILFVGRFNDPRKNIFLLLKSFLQVQKLFPWLKLKLIGDLPDSKISNFIKNNNLEKYIEIHQFVEDNNLPYFYQNSLIFVIPSFQEGLCIAGLESMACGVPVISTKCGGPENYIIDGYNGYLVKNNDEKNLTESLINYIKSNDDFKIKMSYNCRKHIEESYNINKIWPVFLRAINE